MTENPTILLAGGGTGGHLFPGISVAESLKALLPECKPVFLCTNREIDRVILEPTGFEFIAQPIVPPKRTVGGLLRFWRAWRESVAMVTKLLRDRAPAAVVGLGGYAAGVAVKIAANQKIPTAILNPDALPGRANQYLMRYSRLVCCQFEASREHIPSEHRGKMRVTGCPIRRELRQLPDRRQAASRLGIDPLSHTLVITGASQGAQTVNQATLELFKSITLNGWQIVHLSGREHADEVRAGYRELTVPSCVIDFTADMADIWSVADLAISRAGASSCAELTACGIPSILMPYPFHKDMHQRENAKILCAAGAAELVEDTRDARTNAAQLRPVVESLLYDVPRRQKMADAARSLGIPDASDKVAAELLQMLR